MPLSEKIGTHCVHVASLWDLNRYAKAHMHLRTVLVD